MPFGFHKKGEEKRQRIITNITDKEDLDEIKKIAEMLNPNEEVFVVARQSRLKPGGSHFTPNIVFATDRRIIIKDPSMLGMREEVVDIPYDMITSVRLDKGVFSCNIIFRAPGLRSTGRLGMLEKLTGNEYGGGNSGGEDTIITAIPKDKAQDLVEVVRNGMDRQREVYQQQPQSQQQFQPQPTTTPQRTDVDTTSSNNQTISIADELAKLAKLKEQGVISESEFLQMKQDLIRRM